MQTHSVESTIEDFARAQFNVASTDPAFDSQADLFEGGYIDSMGFVELVEFLNGEFGVQVSDEDLLSDNFSTVAGIAHIVSQTLVSVPSSRPSSTCSVATAPSGFASKSLALEETIHLYRRV